MTLSDLYDEYEGQLRRHARRWTRDPHRVEDLVQETLIRAMGHLELLGRLAAYQRRAWLFRTLKNLYLDQERAREREEALLTQIAQGLPATDAFEGELGVLNPFDLVPEKYRDLVRMRYEWGMNSREIAEQLGIPAATVRSRLRLAIKQMRLQAYKLR
jgi:RNA polymerase sigma-70 factor (ECF subfamily)